MTVKQITISLRISKQAVHKTIHKLIKKGVLFYQSGGGVDVGGVTLTGGGVDASQILPISNEKIIKEESKKLEQYKKKVHRSLIPYPVSPSPGKTIRLHNQHFQLKILNGSEGYEKFRKRLTSWKFDGNTIRMNPDSVEVYSNKSFTSLGNPEKAHADSMVYWNNFFLRLQHELKIILIKDGVDNMKECRSHYAECDNELAKEFNRSGEKLSLVGEDGKEWLKVDNSFNLNEFETVHPKFSKEDMIKINSFFQDIRINEYCSMNEIKALIGSQGKLILELAEQSLITATAVNVILKLLVPKDEVVVQDDGLNKKIPDYVG
jgi:hypothetical protein